jgi:hypothetical protein
MSKFKKFSDINKTKVNTNNELDNLYLDVNKDMVCNPNLPIDSTKELVDFDSTELKSEISGSKEDQINETNKVKFIGKVAKFPKSTKASNAFNFLENVKIPKSAIWYIMVEKMDNELQMVKYDYKKGVDLSSFVNDLKKYYIDKYKTNKSVVEKISNIIVDGNDKYSMIKNIHLIEFNS